MISLCDSCNKADYQHNIIHLLTGCEGNSKIPTIAWGEAKGNSWYAKGQQTCYYPHNQSLGVLLYWTNQLYKKFT